MEGEERFEVGFVGEGQRLVVRRQRAGEGAVEGGAGGGEHGSPRRGVSE